MQKFFHSSIIFILIGLLTACANVPLQTVSPQVSLADFKLLNMGLMKQDYRLKLRLQNPNSFPLPISGMNYQLRLNDKEFTHGESKQAVTIPASGEEFLEIDVASNLMRILDEWKDWKAIFNRNFDYRLSGNLSVLNGGPQIPFEYKGDISLLSGTSDK